MKGIGRLLMLAGAAGMAVAAFLPWVTVDGAPIDLDVLRAEVSGVGNTVSGMETVAGPGVLAVGGVIAVLALLNKARKLLMLFGLLVTLAGAGLLYYVLNVVEIETTDNVVKETVATTLINSTAEAGPFVLLASGLAILVGSMLRD